MAKKTNPSTLTTALRRVLVAGPRVLVFLSVAIGVLSIVLRNGKAMVEDCRAELAKLMDDDVRRMFNLGKPGSKVEEDDDDDDEPSAPALVDLVPPAASVEVPA